MSAAQGHLRTLEEEHTHKQHTHTHTHSHTHTHTHTQTHTHTKEEKKREIERKDFINNLVRNYERKNLEQLRQHCEKERDQNTLCLTLKRTLGSKGATQKAGHISVTDCRITVACKTVRAQELYEQGGVSWLSFIPIPFSPRP